VYKSYNKPNPLVSISQKDIASNISQKNSLIVYIGRDSCPTCRVFKPKLIKYLNARHKHIFYFNTQGNNKEIHDFRKFYNNLGVHYVPSIIIIKKGKVINILPKENLNKLEKYLKNLEEM
jgi:predicted bacteriocin transport accessory protein